MRKVYSKGTLHILEQREWFQIILILNGIAVGVVAGLVTIFYRFILNQSENILFKILITIKGNLCLTFIWFLVLALMAYTVGQLVKWEPMISGSGIPQVSGEMKGYLEPNWIKVLIAKIAGGTLCILGGLSLGREGPSVQLGAMSGKGISKILKKNKTEERYLITCGASAGLAAAFNAPLAGIMFALEEIHKNFSSSVLVCAMAATVVADFLSKNVFGLSPVFHFTVDTMVDLKYYWLLLILGAILGVLGAIYNKVMLAGQTCYNEMKRIKPEFRYLIPFFISGVLALYLPEVLAGGHKMIAILGQDGIQISISTMILLLIIKFLFSTVSFGSGAPGGIFFPLLILGAYIGAIYGSVSNLLIGIPEELINNFIILAMAGFFTAIVRAPITGIILIAEMTGNFRHLLSLAVVSIVAYMVANLCKSVPIYESLLERILAKGKIHQSSTATVEETVLISSVIATGSFLERKYVLEVEWPPDCLIVSIKRGEKELIPKGSTILLAGDTITILVNQTDLTKVNKKIEEFCG